MDLKLLLDQLKWYQQGEMYLEEICKSKIHMLTLITEKKISLDGIIHILIKVHLYLNKPKSITNLI